MEMVLRDGIAVGLLDFDFAAPGSPLYDLAQFARMCVPIGDDVSAGLMGRKITDHLARLRVVTQVYGLDKDARGQFLECLDSTMNRGQDFVQRRVEVGDLNFIRILKTWTALSATSAVNVGGRTDEVISSLRLCGRSTEGFGIHSALPGLTTCGIDGQREIFLLKGVG